MNLKRNSNPLKKNLSKYHHNTVTYLNDLKMYFLTNNNDSLHTIIHKDPMMIKNSVYRVFSKSTVQIRVQISI